jgi:hypothetical protein
MIEVSTERRRPFLTVPEKIRSDSGEPCHAEPKLAPWTCTLVAHAHVAETSIHTLTAVASGKGN